MNIWIFYLSILLVSATVFLWTLRDQPLLPAVILAVFVSVWVRLSHHLGPHIGPWHDGYFYYSVVQSISSTGFLQVSDGVSVWYNPSSFFSWPAYHLFSASVLEVISPAAIEPYRGYLPALLALILLFVLWALYKQLVGVHWGFLAAFTTVQLDSFIYYQTQYHVQGFAIVAGALVFLLGFIVMVRRDRRHMLMFLLAGVLLALSHRFSGIVIAFIVVVAAGVMWTYESWHPAVPEINKGQVRVLGSASLLVGFFVFLPHAIYNITVIQTTVYRAAYLLTGFELGAAASAPSTGATGGSIIDSFPLFIKILLGGFAAPAAVYALHPKKVSVRFFVALLGVSGFFGLAVAVIDIRLLVRLILVWYLLLVPLAVWTLTRRDNFSPQLGPRSGLTSSLLICILLMGVMAGTTPSLIDYDADVNNDGYHEVRPIGEQAVQGGEWIEIYHHETSVGVTFRTRMVGNYYARVDQARVGFIYLGRARPPVAIYDADRDPESLPIDTKYYDNGRIYVVATDDDS